MLTFKYFKTIRHLGLSVPWLVCWKGMTFSPSAPEANAECLDAQVLFFFPAASAAGDIFFEWPLARLI